MTEEDVRREIKTPAVLEAFERAKLISLPKAVKEDYLLEDLHFQNITEYVAKEREEAREGGRETGQAEGEAKGRAEGRVEGRAEGEAKAQLEKKQMALAFLKKGIDMPIICQVTGLSEEEILSL